MQRSGWCRVSAVAWVVAVAVQVAACARAQELIDELQDHGRADHGHRDVGNDAGGVDGGGCSPADGGAAGACAFAGCPETFNNLPAGFDLNDVWIGPAGEVWAVGDGGFVGRRSATDGAWCWCAPFPAGTLRGVWGAANDDVFVVGDQTLLRYDGARWLSYNAQGRTLRGVHGTGPTNVWAVGPQGMATHFDGAAWNVDGIVTSYDLNAVWIDPTGVPRAAGRVLLPNEPPGSGENAAAVVVRHSANPAESGWTEEGSFPQRGIVTFQGLSGDSATNIWAVGINTSSGAAAGFGFAARFDGMTWAGVPDPVDAYLYRAFTDVAVGTPDAGAVWLMARGQAGVRHDASGFTVSERTSGMAGIDARGAAMYAVGFDGEVLRWVMGTGWTVDRAARPAAAVTAP